VSHYSKKTRTESPQIIPESYQNEARRIHIPDLPEEIIPGSPEDIKIPVPSSGLSSPSVQGIGTPRDGISTPQAGTRTPREPERISQQHVEDVV
jgi:6-phosphofructo-2-kinase/fructose-2,6-biphosphatase 4